LSRDLGSSVEEIKGFESLLIDLIINSVAQSTIEQLDNVSGKIILAEKIKNGANEIIKKKAVKNVLFSTFSVQLQ
jgi:flagellar basal body-associated protein FliL